MVAVLFAVAALDLWFEITGRPPVGEYVIRWTQRYPIFAAFLVFLVGAMLSHFFWQV